MGCRNTKATDATPKEVTPAPEEQDEGSVQEHSWRKEVGSSPFAQVQRGGRVQFRVQFVKPGEEVVFLPTHTVLNPYTEKVFTVQMHHQRVDQA